MEKVKLQKTPKMKNCFEKFYYVLVTFMNTTKIVPAYINLNVNIDIKKLEHLDLELIFKCTIQLFVIILVYFDF